MPFTHGHALLIGVGTYQYHPILNVPVTVRDAQAVADVLKNPQFCGYPEEQVVLLHDEEATKAGVLAAFDALATKTGVDDTVCIFYCGHGADGTDGNYYLSTYDSKVSGNRFEQGTGISVQELLAAVTALKVRRALLIFNACHSGAVTGTLGPNDLVTNTLAPDATDALLSAGDGRIVISACRREQFSHIGTGNLTIFSEAVVDGLKGTDVANRNGSISAYDLYQMVYETVTEAVKEQEPVLTIRNGVGPFAVALYRGASSLGAFTAPQEPPETPAVRKVDPQKSRRRYELLMGNMGQQIDTGGGAYISGHVNTGGGAFAGRDMSIAGDAIGGDKIAGDKFGGDKVTGDKLVGGDKTTVFGGQVGAIGRGAHGTATQTTGVSGPDLVQLFDTIQRKIDVRPDDPNVGKPELKSVIEQIKDETAKGEDANPNKVERWLGNLAGMAPDIFDVTVAALTSPVAGIAMALKKIVEKSRAEQRSTFN